MRRRRAPAAPPSPDGPAVGLWPVLAAGLAFWFLAAFAENALRPPTSVRILLPSGVFIVLIATEALRGIRLSRAALLAASAVTAFALVMGLRAFRDGAEVLENTSAATRADLAALELASEVNPDFVLTRELDYPWLLPVGVREYQAAVGDYDSTPAYSERELAEAPPEAQAGADRALAAALGLALQPQDARPRGSRSTRITFHGLPPRWSCRRARAAESIRTGIRFGPGMLILNASLEARAQVLLARFSEVFWSVNLGVLEGGQDVRVSVLADRSSRPWELGLSGSGRFLVCGSRLVAAGG
jgi:hypothetical protein